MNDLAGVNSQAGQGGGASMRIGTVTAFDPAAGTLTVNIGGTDLPGVFYNPAYLPTVGDTVAVLNSGPTWYVMGSTINATARTIPTTATVTPTDTVTSTSYADAPTNVGPAVSAIIGGHGKALVTISASIVGTSPNNAFMGFAISGASTAAASDAQCLAAGVNQGTSPFTFSLSRTVLVTGLTPGSNTFTAKYRVSAGSALFFSRDLIVLPY